MDIFTIYLNYFWRFPCIGRPNAADAGQVHGFLGNGKNKELITECCSLFFPLPKNVDDWFFDINKTSLGEKNVKFHRRIIRDST